MTAPVTEATLGEEYRYEPTSIRSLADVHARRENPEDSGYTYRFWDTEELTWELAGGPDWLSIDAETGVLTGTPPAAGEFQVTVAVSNQFEDRAEQAFEFAVAE
ncbi:MAG: Ig domain-containing protein [Armatimonadota bacterium]